VVMCNVASQGDTIKLNHDTLFDVKFTINLL